jgi:hypothetical protein
MLTPADFLQVTKWGGILTLTFGAIAALSFLFKWGIRFRLVGVTGFMGVLTGGLFGLSIVPLSPTVVPGSVRYTVVFDTDHHRVRTRSNLTPSRTQSIFARSSQPGWELYHSGAGGRPSGTRTLSTGVFGSSAPIVFRAKRRPL